MIKRAEGPAAAWGSSHQGSWVNTANPFSQMFSATDRLPEKWVNMFPNTEGGRRAAHITFKVGFDALLAAGAVALYRGIQHATRMADIAKSDSPAKGMQSQLSTTFAGSLDAKKQKKSAAVTELEQPTIGSMGNAMSAALPLGAVILATSLAYRATDNYLDKKRNQALDEAIASKENMLKRLIKTRARLAKGNAPDSETQKALGAVANESLYVKHAGLEKQGGFWDIVRGTVGGYAALNSLVLAAAAVGSYAYFSKADENNVRYRAMKHGLQEYARVKSGFTPVAIIPTKSQKFFSEIDEEDKQEKKRKKDSVAATLDPIVKLKSVREEMPVLTETYNKPISLTL